ncbi:hypothetical protein HY633_02030 [Candidatus Uhrbacteria bacterium]|nr:hypothetical protein [Candidatus Uhrbacteria bacterium]
MNETLAELKKIQQEFDDLKKRVTSTMRNGAVRNDKKKLGELRRKLGLK